MHTIKAEAEEFNPKNYSNSFCNFADDVNGDGWADLIVVDFPGKETWWFENPQTASGAWQKRAATRVTNNESPSWLDVDGDGKRELLFGDAEARIAMLRPGDDVRGRLAPDSCVRSQSARHAAILTRDWRRRH